MRNPQDNIILIKSKAFAVKVVKLKEHLVMERHEYDLSRQMMRSGTSVGANVKEALRAQSTPDFISKLNIALKEASETEYWLELLYDTNYIDKLSSDILLDDCRELIKLLTSIIKTTKTNNNINNAHN